MFPARSRDGWRTDPRGATISKRLTDGAASVRRHLHPKREPRTIGACRNGSSLFTGDAGQGESNIRRSIIENDWLEAIVALPLNDRKTTLSAIYGIMHRSKGACLNLVPVDSRVHS